MERLKSLLDEKVAQYNNTDFIANDPISFPHSFSRREDIEIVALLASVIAWGNRKMILRSGNKMFHEIMHSAPYEFVMSGEWEQLDDRQNIHRTFFVSDLKYICRGLRAIFLRYGSMEQLFVGHSTWDGIGQRWCNDKAYKQPCQRERKAGLGMQAYAYDVALVVP